ncbi:hypothetical protein [Tatumella punctata]|uniref:Uncharacterized protein n=1 Tax=Tatumella punctata TaxID=399969 RepID=A0ABW1VP15_9GAMM
MAEVAKAVGSILGMNTGTVSVNTPTAVNQDATISQADDLLRQRQRQGVNANLSNGSAGSANVGATSSGQKTLLGG